VESGVLGGNGADARTVHDVAFQGLVMVCPGEPVEGGVAGSAEQTLNSWYE